MASIQKLPTEIICRIADMSTWIPNTYQNNDWPRAYHVKTGGRNKYYGRHHNALARTCRHLYAILNPVLYHRNLMQDHPMDSCVFWAVRMDRLSTIKAAVAYGADLEATGAVDEEDWKSNVVRLGTALHRTVAAERVEIAEYLLEQGVEVHSPSMRICRCCSYRGRFAYPLHIAFLSAEGTHKSSYMMALLARNGAYHLSEQEPAPYRLATRGYWDVVELMLPRADPEIVTKVLHQAVIDEEIEIITRILQHPYASVGAPSTDGHTAIHEAVSVRNTDVLKLLLEQPHADLAAKTKYLGDTPLHRAARYLKHPGVEAIEILLQQSNIDINDANIAGQTPLCIAENNGAKEIFDLLISRPEIDVNKGAPLRAAAGKGVLEMVEHLFARSDIDVNNGAPLCVAAQYDAEKIFKLLLSHPDIDVNQVDTDGSTALHAAVRSGAKNIVDLLLAHPDTDINICDAMGRTILHKAAAVGRQHANGTIETIDYLLDNGLPINKASTESGTALSVAIEARNYGAAVHLLRRGANPLIVGPEENEETEDVKTGKFVLHSCLQRDGETSYEELSQTALVRELLSWGIPFDESTIDPNDPTPHRGMDEGTPLFFAAAFAQNVDCVKLLLEAGAGPNSRVLKSDYELLEYGEYGEQQLLLTAVLRNFWGKKDVEDDDVQGAKASIIELLIRGGACIGEGGAGYSALAFTCLNDSIEYGSYELVKLMLDNATAASVEFGHLRYLMTRYSRRARRAIKRFAKRCFPERVQEEQLRQQARKANQVGSGDDTNGYREIDYDDDEEDPEDTQKDDEESSEEEDG